MCYKQISVKEGEAYFVATFWSTPSQFTGPIVAP